MPLTFGEVRLHHTGHSGFLIENGKVNIYVDPFQLDKLTEEQKKFLQEHKATHICITHLHNDHLSPEDIKYVSNEQTQIIAPSCCNSLKKNSNYNSLDVGEIKVINGVEIKAVHAYNTDKKFHTKQMGFVGFIINVDGVKFYHAGDTDVIDEMKDYVDLDAALLPVSGTYTMTAEQAIQAAKIIKSKVFVPMHYGVIVGDKAMADTFVAGVENGKLPEF